MKRFNYSKIIIRNDYCGIQRVNNIGWPLKEGY